jgi:hypothetical protein
VAKGTAWISLLVGLVLVGCLSGETTVPAAKGSGTEHPGRVDAAAFATIQPGMTAAQVEARLGRASSVQGDAWYYGEARAPRVGETIPSYVIVFSGGRVVSTAVVPGADATGSAP